MTQDNFNVDIEVNTEQIDEAVDKAQELADTLDEITPKIVVRNSKNCTFNFYVGK